MWARLHTYCTGAALDHDITASRKSRTQQIEVLPQEYTRSTTRKTEHNTTRRDNNIQRRHLTALQQKSPNHSADIWQPYNRSYQTTPDYTRLQQTTLDYARLRQITPPLISDSLDNADWSQTTEESHIASRRVSFIAEIGEQSSLFC